MSVCTQIILGQLGHDINRVLCSQSMSWISWGTCSLRLVPLLGEGHPVMRKAASVALWGGAIFPDSSMVRITPQTKG